MRTLSSPQKTGWSALHFSAEKGNSATAEMLLKAGANAHLKDKVCHPTTIITLSSLFLHLFFLVKNGLTALDIAEVKEIEKYVEYTTEPLYYHPSQLSVSRVPCYKLVAKTDYKTVISLLKEHMGEESTSPPSHHVSARNEICLDPRRGDSAIFATML